MKKNNESSSTDGYALSKQLDTLSDTLTRKTNFS